MAIESVAALSNSLVKMLDTLPSSGLTSEHIEEALQSYQKSRKRRAKGFSDFSNYLTREEAYAHFGAKFTAVWVDPYMSNKTASTYKTCQLDVALMHI